MNFINSSPFVRASNPWLAKWQSAVMKVVSDRLQQENPGMEPHEIRTLALQDPMIAGTNLHVENAKAKHPAPSVDDMAFVHRLHKTGYAHPQFHYYASHYYYQQSVSRLVEKRPELAGQDFAVIPPDNKPTGFPDTDSNVAQWILAGAEWESFANPFPSPYIDWVNKVPRGVSKDSFIKTFSVYTIPDNAKVVILGDFGTGLTDGILMLMSILINQQPDIIIHLGDIYYAGMNSEVDAYINMFNVAFQRTGRKVPVFSIPGNHEYMSGGAPYFNKVLQMNAANGFPQYAQAASYFCLRNQSGTLQYLAMDTGLNSVDAWLPTALQGAYSPWLWFSEADWCVDKLKTFQQSNGRTILLSHHQLYTVSGEINDGNNVEYVGSAPKSSLQYLNGNLYNVFAPYFGQVAAWYWGHEHILGIYRNNELTNNAGVPLKKGRLVGNSGYEQWDQDAGYAVKGDRFHYYSPAVQVGITSVNWTMIIPGQHGAPPTKVPRTSNFFNHGWALLNVTASAINASYWQFPVMSPDITSLPPVTNVPPPTTLNFSETL